MPQAHVQVVLDGETMPAGLEAALRRVGATASFGPMSEVLRFGLKSTADAVVVVAPEDAQSGYDGLQELFSQVANHPRGTLVLEAEGSNAPRPAHPPAVPVSFSSQSSAEELAARITTMIEMRPSLESLRQSGATTQRSDEGLARQYRQQLRLASQLQREFLPHTLPHYPGISFSAVYRPMDYVSGDIYDIRRLDDDHVAIALADAQGHGICAALLTVFIKRALRGETRHGGRHQLLRPGEMLSRLNGELLEADLTESQFAAVVYALLNLRTRQVELARGGAPYPIRRHADGGSELVRPAGPLVGVLPNASFAVESFELMPGESLILYSDGLDYLVRSAPPDGTRATTSVQSRRGVRKHGFVPPGQSCGVLSAVSAVAVAPAERGTGVVASVRRPHALTGPRPPADTAVPPATRAVAPDEIITATRWFERLRSDGVAAALEHVERRHDTLRRLGHPLDDMTVLAINADP